MTFTFSFILLPFSFPLLFPSSRYSRRNLRTSDGGCADPPFGQKYYYFGQNNAVLGADVLKILAKVRSSQLVVASHAYAINLTVL